MPLTAYSLQIIKNVLDNVNVDPEKTGQVLTLSYPDVVASRSTVEGIFGPDVVGVHARADGQSSINWHKASDITTEILDTKALFSALGYAMTSIDQVEGRGGERIHDLSDPLPEHLKTHMLEEFDLVFDCITNQVFNIAQAWWTMISCCRVGGWILSVTPVQMVNQGFWNVSPAAYFDFALANGLELHYQAIVGVNVEKFRISLGPTIRERNVLDDTMNVALMRKRVTKRTPSWPVMTKFKTHPKCQIESKQGPSL